MVRVSDTSKSDCKARVLVVENDPRTAELHRENLEWWGYAPIVAQGFGVDLLRDAERKAYDYACHVALVDMRLIDDYDKSDQSGLQLVPKLMPTLSIIVSGSGDDRKTTLKATKGYGAFNAVGKEKDLSQLREALEEAIEAAFACNHGPKILIPKRLLQTISDLLAPGKPEQVRELFKHLFPESKRLKIETFEKATHPPSFAKKGRPTVVLVRVDGQLIPNIVKLGSHGKGKKSLVEIENKNYQRYVDNRIPSTFYGRLHKYKALWHIDGIVYDFLGGSPQNFQRFSEYYPDRSSKEICAAFDHLLNETWGAVYRNTKVDSNESLFVAYCERWDKKKWFAELTDYCAEHPAKFENSLLNKELVDPVHWVVRNTNFGQQDEDASALPHLQSAVVHGDLRCENLFVDRDENTWVINYERVGPGPIFSDFVSLEVDIMTRLLTLSQNEHVLFVELCLALSVPSPTGELHQCPERIWKHQEARKALLVLQHIRRLSYRITGKMDHRAYLWGMVLESTYRYLLAIKEPQVPDVEQMANHLFIMAAILCYHLDNWDKSWPHSIGPNILWLNERQQQSLQKQADYLRDELQFLKARYQREVDNQDKLLKDIRKNYAKLQELGEIEQEGVKQAIVKLLQQEP